jgi:hypothetical protein
LFLFLLYDMFLVTVTVIKGGVSNIVFNEICSGELKYICKDT